MMQICRVNNTSLITVDMHEPAPVSLLCTLVLAHCDQLARDNLIGKREAAGTCGVITAHPHDYVHRKFLRNILAFVSKKPVPGNLVANEFGDLWIKVP